ncbi:MAG: phosphoglycerate kinase [Bacteroidota bacterium]
MFALRHVQDYNFKHKKALIRVDLNVPLNEQGEVVDDTRLQGAIPTIRQVLDQGGAAVLLSHLGRPQAGYEERFSLSHLVAPLSRAIGTPVKFAPSCVGPATQAQVQQLRPGEVLLLENVRFQAGETTSDPDLARALAVWGDVYVNDAFGTAHRAHASTVGVAHHFHDKLAGYLMHQELASADKVLHAHARPLVAIIGGAKISDKIKPLEQLINRVDSLLLGGGVANTFQKALGGQLGASLVENDQVKRAQQLIQQAQQKGVRLVLPADVVVAPSIETGTEQQVVPGGVVPTDWLALDIGPQAQQAFAAQLQAAQTILWCGPIGVFEKPAFRQGTQAVAAAVAKATHQGAFSLIGGGDSAAAIKGLGYASQVSYVSTGGGALLAYLGGEPLPGVQALQDNDE